MSKKKKVEVIRLNVGPVAKGHYSFQGSKTTFDSRPRKQRTRAGINRQWRKED